ncbi:hypothetical protein [Jannaschia ovalis]|uniref:hypothetical protein n=1 Tax=Jannaschia ovalis TaxID=3038773 RepID=UPI0038B3D995
MAAAVSPDADRRSASKRRSGSEIRVIAQPARQHRRRTRQVLLPGLQAEQAQRRGLGQLGMIEQRLVGARRLGQPVGQAQKFRPDQRQRRRVGIFGANRLDMAQRQRRLVDGDQLGDGAGQRRLFQAFGIVEIAQPVAARFPLESDARTQRGRGRGGRLARDAVDMRGGLQRPAPVARIDMQLAQQAADAQMARRRVLRSLQHAQRQPVAALADQGAGIALGLGGGMAGDLRGLRKLLHRETRIAVQAVRGGHQVQKIGVARRLRQRGAQVDDGVLRALRLDGPAGAQLQRAHLARIGAQHGLDLGARLAALALPVQHPGQQNADHPRLAALLALGQKRAQPVDRARALAGIEADRPLHRGIEPCARPVARRLALARQLGQRGIGALGAQEEPHKDGACAHIVGRGPVGQGPQDLSRLGHAALRHVPGHQHRHDLGVARVERDQLHQALIDRVLAPVIGQEADAHHLQVGAVGVAAQRVVEDRQRLGLAPGIERGLQRDAQHHRLVGARRAQRGDGLGQRVAGARIVLAHRVAEGDRMAQDGGLGRVRGDTLGDVGMAAQRVPVGLHHRDLSQREAPLDPVGLAFGQQRVFARGLAQIALRQEHPAQRDPRLGMVAVDLEDVAILDQRAGEVAVLDERLGRGEELVDTRLVGLAS